MYIQLNLEDTKAFKELEASRKVGSTKEITRSPIIEAIKKYPSKIILAAGAFLSIQVTFYILIAFLLLMVLQAQELQEMKCCLLFLLVQQL